MYISFFFFLLLLGSRAPSAAANDFARNSLFNLLSKVTHKERRNSTQAEFTIQDLNPEPDEAGDSSDSSTFTYLQNTIDGMPPQYLKASFCGSKDSIVGTFRLWLEDDDTKVVYYGPQNGCVPNESGASTYNGNSYSADGYYVELNGINGSTYANWNQKYYSADDCNSDSFIESRQTDNDGPYGTFESCSSVGQTLLAIVDVRLK